MLNIPGLNLSFLSSVRLPLKLPCFVFISIWRSFRQCDPVFVCSVHTLPISLAVRTSVGGKHCWLFNWVQSLPLQLEPHFLYRQRTIFKWKEVSECTMASAPLRYENRAVCESIFIYIPEDQRSSHKLPNGIASACRENLFTVEKFFFSHVLVFNSLPLSKVLVKCTGTRGASWTIQHLKWVAQLNKLRSECHSYFRGYRASPIWTLTRAAPPQAKSMKRPSTCLVRCFSSPSARDPIHYS